jgi:hypothetical protein
VLNSIAAKVRREGGLLRRSYGGKYKNLIERVKGRRISNLKGSILIKEVNIQITTSIN